MKISDILDIQPGTKYCKPSLDIIVEKDVNRIEKCASHCKPSIKQPFLDASNMASCVGMTSQSQQIGSSLKTYANGEPIINEEEQWNPRNGYTEIQNGDDQNFGPVVRRKKTNKPSPLSLDKKTLRKRDSFEVLEEWVNISIHEGAEEDSLVDVDIDELPEHIGDALSSSFHSGVGVDKVHPGLVADSNNSPKETLPFTLNSSPSNVANGIRSLNSGRFQSKDSQHTSSKVDTGGSKLKRCSSLRSSKTRLVQSGISPTSKTVLSGKTQPNVGKTAEKNQNGLSHRKSPAPDKPISFQKRIPNVSTKERDKMTPPKGIKSPRITRKDKSNVSQSPKIKRKGESGEKEEKKYGITANHFVTGKSLLQKLRESTENYVSKCSNLLKTNDSDKTQKSDETSKNSPNVSKDKSRPVENEPLVPLKRMDSFELLEEWCNLSMPPETEDDFENVLNQEGNSTIKGTESVEVIANVLKQMSLSSDCDTENKTDMTSPNSACVTPSTSNSMVSSEMSKSVTSPQTESKESNANVERILERLQEEKAEVISSVFDTSFDEADSFDYSKKQSSDVQKSGPESKPPSSPLSVSRSENEQHVHSAHSDVAFILDILLWKTVNICEHFSPEDLHLDLQDLQDDPMSSSYIFQEMNFIPSPYSPPVGSQSCFNLTSLADSDDFSSSAKDDIDSNDETDLDQVENLPSDTELKKNRVFKEPNFCPSPASTPLPSPCLSPRALSPMPVGSRPPFSRSGSSSPNTANFAAALGPLSLANGGSLDAKIFGFCDRRSSSSSSASARSPRGSHSPDNVSVDSGALSIASWELDLSIAEDAAQESSPRTQQRLNGPAKTISKSITPSSSKDVNKPLSSIPSRICKLTRSSSNAERGTQRRTRVMYDLNGRKIVTSEDAGSHHDDLSARIITSPSRTIQQNKPSPFVRRNDSFGRGSSSSRLQRPGTPRFQRKGLSKAISMPNVGGSNDDDNIVAIDNDELVEKQRQQMQELRHERAKLQQHLAKQRSPKSPTKKLYSPQNTAKLGGRELEAVTRLNTLCNGKQLAKLITKATATMIASVTLSACEASKVKWAEELETVINTQTDDVIYRTHTTDVKEPECKSILVKRDPTFLFPYNDDPITPVVLRKTNFRMRKFRSFADLDPAKVC